MSVEESKQLKRPVSAYLLYTATIRAEVKKANPDMANKDLMRKLGEMWKDLSESEKKVFNEEYSKNKALYEKSKPLQKEEKKLPKPKKSSVPKPDTKKKAGK